MRVRLGGRGCGSGSGSGSGKHDLGLVKDVAFSRLPQKKLVPLSSNYLYTAMLVNKTVSVTKKLC